ncbi:hypothetical protein ACET3Z_010223 [Daucus carota]
MLSILEFEPVSIFMCPEWQRLYVLALEMGLRISCHRQPVGSSSILDPLLLIKIFSQLCSTLLDMVQTLEAIKGGGGSIKVGTTGTISSLMSKELESMRYAPRKAIPANDKSSAATILESGGITSPERLRPRLSANEASSSNSNNISDRNGDLSRKEKHYNRRSHNIPMLNPGNVSVDATPIRKKSDKKGPYLVEIVDIKCGHPDRAWATPLANRLKRLSFSKLSESTN